MKLVCEKASKIQADGNTVAHGKSLMELAGVCTAAIQDLTGQEQKRIVDMINFLTAVVPKA